MLILPNYDLADTSLRIVWQSIESRHQGTRDRWANFEQSMPGSFEPLLDEINGRLKRCHFVRPEVFGLRDGSILTETGEILIKSKLLEDVLNALEERSADVFQDSWQKMTIVLLHELIHQRQYDDNPDAFASWHRDSQERNRDKGYLYCQAVNPYEIPAHAYTDSRRIRDVLARFNGIVNLKRALEFVEYPPACYTPALFAEGRLGDQGILNLSDILNEYKSMTRDYLNALEAEPEPYIFVPAIT